MQSQKEKVHETSSYTFRIYLKGTDCLHLTHITSFEGADEYLYEKKRNAILCYRNLPPQIKQLFSNM